jgi:hypothetical protein
MSMLEVLTCLAVQDPPDFFYRLYSVILVFLSLPVLRELTTTFLTSL